MENDVASLIEGLKALNFSQLVLVFLLGLGAGLAILGLDRLSRSATHLIPSQRLTVFRIQTVAKFLVYLGAGAAILATLLSSKPELLVALLGTAAVAVGFALKDVTASFFAGLILLFDQPFQVGDRVTFGEHYGDIISIGLRSVRLLTLGHDTVTIPNSAFLTDAVASSNSGSLSMMVSVPLFIAIGADAEVAADLLREVVVTSRYAWLKNGVSIEVAEKLGEHGLPAIALTARCYIVDIQVEKAYATDIALRAGRAFREAGIARFERCPG